MADSRRIRRTTAIRRKGGWPPVSLCASRHCRPAWESDRRWRI